MRDGQPKVTYHPIGRLGNQIFQAAAAIGYSKKYGVTWGAPRRTNECPNFHSYFPGLPIAEESFRTYKEHPDLFCETHGTHKDLCHFDYHDIPFHPGGVRLMGFFQSWKYFANAEDEVKKAFRLPHVAGYEDYVSIHVRRGDYVQNAGSFPPVTVEYITQAMNYVFGKTGCNTFLFFSDDIGWCQQQFASFRLNEQTTIMWSTETDEFKDLLRQSSCGHHIIANSSYSWWAAYLGHNPDRIVVSPSHKRGNWFGMSAGVRRDCVDLLPPAWHQIEFR